MANSNKFFPSWFFLLIGVLEVLGGPVNASSWQGMDDFATGISGAKWTVAQGVNGGMTLSGAAGHASFLVPYSSVQEQEARLLWNGRPTANTDWFVEVRGHNTAAFSGQGDNQLHLVIGDPRSLTGGTPYSMAVGLQRGNFAGATQAKFESVNFASGANVTAATSLAVTDFRLRIVYRISSQVFESWYDDSGTGSNWRLLRSESLTSLWPGATASSEFAVLLIGNCYYGPITEGQLYVDDFTLSNSLPTPPVISSAATASGTVGQAFNYQITANNTPTSFNATGLPDGLTVNTATGLITGTPTSAGSSTVTLSASNAGGTGTKTLTLTINPAAPVISSAATATGTVGQAFSYQITASGSPTSFNATGLPAGLTVNTGTGLITGTPTTAGSSTVTLSASNAGGTGTKSLTLTINPPPTITAQPASQTVTAGANVTFSVTATGTTPLAYQWRKNGVVISGATNATYTINTVAFGDAGIYQVVVSGSGGKVISDPAQLIIQPPPSSGAPQIVAQPHVIQTLEGRSAVLGVVVTGDAPLSYAWTKGGNSFNDDGVIGFANPTFTVNENVPSATITVVRQESTTGSAAVTLLTTTNGTATGFSDFVPLNVAVNFGVGESIKNISLPILNDVLVEGNETVQLILTNFTGEASAGVSQAILNIVDDDVAPGVALFSSASYPAGTGLPTLVFTSVQPSDSGIYRVTVSNGSGSVESKPMELRVHKAVVLPASSKDLPPIKDNGFKLLVDTVPGGVYVVEANEDLSPAGWVEIHRFTSNGDAVDFVDQTQAAKSASRRFYRVRQTEQ